MAERTNNIDVDLSKLKAGGFIKELGKDLFSVRLRVPGGRMAVSRLKKIVEVAEKYGGEFVHLSVRQSIELIHVDFKHINDVAEELDDVRQKVASCGARVRVPVACGGCEYNPKGLMDTQKSALEIDAKLFGIETGHHKFKVAFAGCPSDCPKSATNDVGFQGAVLPALDRDACIGCGLCIKTCTVGAIAKGEDDTPVFASERCIYCGDCVKVCPSEAWKAEKSGYTVRIGGKWGRNPLVGTLFATFLPEGKVVDFISAVLAWYRENSEGLGRIRLGDVIIRKGTGGLLDDLRGKFPEYVVDTTIPPQRIDTQIGKRP
ncbi:MAG: 4Fe-4S dicluster domain-containing protein [Deltaproteobacteria bacterium]|nr:MAG: 4Fe-4S dicluster domain-containing protein [Deltaproteobacteria bacterium]